uniref:Uncharacterized protein n=2 Tax=Chaetoceros debilis TaxID=122233 RepID=A0A7S3PYD6_9STRA
MSKKIFATALVAAATLETTSAFAPATISGSRASTGLNAETDRREILGNFAKALGAGAFAFGANQSNGESSQLLAGLTNPAQESWRGSSKGKSSWRGSSKGSSFTPGKGMRAHDDELIAGLTNPAQSSWRGSSKGSSFTPGKGMRAHDDELIAGLTNPAQESWRGSSKGKSFTPGKGMRAHDDDLC